MPYIPKEDRPTFDEHLFAIAEFLEAPGDLSYCLARLMFEYWSYCEIHKTYTEIEGAVQGTLREFYRQVVAPYEDVKRAANGDVFELLTAPKEDKDEGDTENLSCGCNKG